MGTRIKEKLLDIVGLEFHAGLTVEAGLRQTVNLETRHIENEPVTVVKAGVKFKVTLAGFSMGARLGIDTEDPAGGLIHIEANPDREGTLEVAGAAPTLIAPSGSYKVNPAGVLTAQEILHEPR